MVREGSELSVELEVEVRIHNTSFSSFMIFSM